jgi:hypothetical protein
MSDFDPLLEHAKRDPTGAVAIAHLQRQDEDYWDALVVGQDGRPLVFLGEPRGMAGEVVREDGAVLMALVSTPPGVSPSGLMATPVNEWGSPLGKIISVVTEGMSTQVEPPGGDPRPLPAQGEDRLKSLLEQVAFRNEDGYLLASLEASGGGEVSVVVDWDRRPLMVWLDLPDAGRSLTMVTLPPDNSGLVCQVLDDDLRPPHSGAALLALRDSQP